MARDGALADSGTTNGDASSDDMTSGDGAAAADSRAADDSSATDSSATDSQVGADLAGTKDSAPSGDLGSANLQAICEAICLASSASCPCGWPSSAACLIPHTAAGCKKDCTAALTGKCAAPFKDELSCWIRAGWPGSPPAKGSGATCTVRTKTNPPIPPADLSTDACRAEEQKYDACWAP